MECEYCHKSFNTIGSLKSHQAKAQYCLMIRGKPLTFACSYCQKQVTSKQRLYTHLETCKARIEDKFKNSIVILEERLEAKNKIIVDQSRQIKELQDKLENIAIQLINKPVVVDETMSGSDDYLIEPLYLNDMYYIEYRSDDGYINVTNLCVAGEKEFDVWNNLEETKRYLQILSEYVTGMLIKIENDDIWVHPQVAVNIAQWISPYFEDMVSSWIYRLGGIVPCEEKNIIYIQSLMTENTYKIGKILKLSDCEHDVVYYHGCRDEKVMNMSETLILSRLDEYKDPEYNDRFVIPKNQTLHLFIQTIIDCIKNIEMSI